jgi:hypothetical protein
MLRTTEPWVQTSRLPPLKESTVDKLGATLAGRGAQIDGEPPGIIVPLTKRRVRMLRRLLIGAVGIGLAMALSACQGLEAPATTPTLTPSLSSTSPPTPSPSGTPAFTGRLRPLIVALPDRAMEKRGPAGGEFGARTAAMVITFVGQDAVENRLEELGFVRGALKQWTLSGGDTSILLLQFLDEPSAAEYVAYSAERAGTDRELPGIEGGVLVLTARGAHAIFHRGGIAVELGMSARENFNIDEFHALVAQQYDRLPA